MAEFIIGYFISRNILKIFLKLFFKLRVSGLGNLPNKAPYIVACNHASYLDPPILSAGVPAGMRFLARESLFTKGPLGWWMKSVGCIPVKGSKGSAKALRDALGYLSRGGILAVFPEGTRSIDGSLKEAKTGIGFLVSKSGVPIVPAYIKGSKEALRKHSRSFNFKPVHIYFGKRIESDDFKKVNKKDHYKKISQGVMAGISQLKTKHGE